jgi:hypothetical protein
MSLSLVSVFIKYLIQKYTVYKNHDQLMKSTAHLFVTVHICKYPK